MRWYVSIGAVLVAGVLAGGDVSGAPGATNQTGHQLAEKEATPSVDVELILAVDVSYSMDMDELAIQREGYAQAIVSKEFLQALKTGPNGKIAVTYFEWAASTDQKIIIPWRVIDGPETADAVANEIMKTPVRRASRTSISGAINFAMPLFDDRHQRPADHGKGAVLFHDGYRQSRLLLRGLRDRRARCLRGVDQGPRQVQGSDPHQASARGRRPYAGAPGRAGRREGAARQLPDRREDLAGPLGAIGLFPGWVSRRRNHNAFGR